MARTLHEPPPGSEPSASKATTAWRVALGEHPAGGGPEEDLVVVEREADREDDGECVHGDGDAPEALTGEQPKALVGRQHLRIGAIERHSDDDHRRRTAPAEPKVPSSPGRVGSSSRVATPVAGSEDGLTSDAVGSALAAWSASFDGPPPRLADLGHGGRAADALMELADRVDNAMIVVASARWTDPDRTHLRSVARRLARDAHHPVLVVPAERVPASAP